MITKLFLLFAMITLAIQSVRRNAPTLAFADRVWGKLLDLKNFE